MIAPEHIEPYGVRLLLRGDLGDPVGLVARLLENVARRCDQAGASVIGHLKAHVRTAEGSFHCSLTSLRSGARCAGPQVERPVTARNLELDVAVLVYGLPRAVIAEATEKALKQLQEAGVSEWSYRSETANRGDDPFPEKPTADHAHRVDDRQDAAPRGHGRDH